MAESSPKRQGFWLCRKALLFITTTNYNLDSLDRRWDFQLFLEASPVTVCRMTRRAVSTWRLRDVCTVSSRQQRSTESSLVWGPPGFFVRPIRHTCSPLEDSPTGCPRPPGIRCDLGPLATSSPEVYPGLCAEPQVWRDTDHHLMSGAVLLHLPPT